MSFMRTLWAVVHGLESVSKHMKKTLGVTGPQRLVIRLVDHYESLSPGDLAELMHVHPSSLTGVLRRLEKARLVSRRPDPEDGRRAILTLTARGRAINAKRAGTVEASVQRLLASTKASKLESARQVLRDLAEELER